MNTVLHATHPAAEEYHVGRFFDLSTDMFLIAGFDGFFRKVNTAFERISGFTNDELRAMRYTDLLHPDDLADAMKIVQEHGQSGDAVMRYECRFRCKDGGYRWLSFAATPPENGLIYSSCRDITEQKEMTERLRRNEERYRQIVETTTEGIISIDEKGNITFVNRRTLEMFGYAEDEMIGQPIINFVQPEEAVRQKLHELDMKKTHQNEVCFVRRDGSEFWALNNSSPILNDKGEPIGALGLIADVTEQRRQRLDMQAQNESLVRANHELALARRNAEESTRLKSEFLATMSHELRTPLNAIIGYTEIQLAGMTGELNEEQTDYQMRTLVNAENLLRLINDVLDLAKIEARRITLTEKAFVVSDVIKSVVYQTKVMSEAKLLMLEYYIDPTLPTSVVGDYLRIKQILVNLVSNAIKFTDTGRVDIRVERVGDQRWELNVSDTGVGIPTHAQEYIFDEFRQVDGTSQRRHGGTGLGLAIVRQLATMMGGSVRVRSRIGEGSTFTINLPLVTEMPAIADVPISAPVAPNAV